MELQNKAPQQPSAEQAAASSFRRSKYKESAPAPEGSRPGSTANSGRPTPGDSEGAKSRGAKPGIVASYIWLDRYKVDRTFKEPQLFLPNANII